MKIVYKHNLTGKYLKVIREGESPYYANLVDDIIDSSVFNHKDFFPYITDYTSKNYDNEYRKQKLNKLKSL